ncbi:MULTISPECIES: heme NO-binding domain-containing protein [unclassified Ruegeria]|uniref:heme NO-binding domain-containing protein n=1 Tax=unclassified Ruegeria TaxID=2625375 RepID=UPI0014882C0E|nr:MULTISPECIES: heme NO-binding domain-containing protein [unclassified Ruegeria]
MHGLIIKAIQSFVCANYGRQTWVESTMAAGLEFADFEAMLTYDVEIYPRVLSALCRKLDRPRSDVLEDLGTYLVSHPNMEGLRRLLRFGGVTYVEFLQSLDDLSDRVRLAVSDLILPQLELQQLSQSDFRLHCHPGLEGYPSVMTGVLRAMADDYGSLVFLSQEATQGPIEVLKITLVESAFAKGRNFELGAHSHDR